MRILFNEDGELRLVCAGSLSYNNDEEAAVVEEMGYSDQIVIPMNKKKYDKYVQELLKNGYIDWSEFEGHYSDDEE